MSPLTNVLQLLSYWRAPCFPQFIHQFIKVKVQLSWVTRLLADKRIRLGGCERGPLHRTSRTCINLTSSKPITILLLLQCSRKWSKTSSLLLLQVPLTAYAARVIYWGGQRFLVNGQNPKILCGQRSDCEKLTVKSWPRSQLWLQGIWEWLPHPPWFMIRHPCSH